MRAVTAATTAAALSIPRKSLDNLIARIGLDLPTESKQGVERRIPVSTVEDLALTVLLSDQLSVPAREAYALARRLFSRDQLESPAPPSGATTLGRYIRIGVNIPAFRADLHARLEQAIETQVRPRRGRPPKRRVPLPGLGDA